MPPRGAPSHTVTGLQWSALVDTIKCKGKFSNIILIDNKDSINTNVACWKTWRTMKQAAAAEIIILTLLNFKKLHSSSLGYWTGV